MSVTPRMIAARNAAMEHMTGDVWRVGCQLECELNAANARINRLQDIINRAHLAFFSDSSDRKVSIAMHRILDEEVRKETKP